MKIYFAHSSELNYKKLYVALSKSSLNNKHELILPHSSKVVNSKEIISSCGLLIAEVSLPSTGLGIELGWAYVSKVTIICVYKKGSKFSSSLKFLTPKFIEYENANDLVKKLEAQLQ